MMTLRTRLGTAPDMPAAPRQGAFAGAELLLQEGAANVRGEGSRDSKSTHAEVELELKAIFGRNLSRRGGRKRRRPPAEMRAARGATAKTALRFKNASGSKTVALAGEKRRTIVDIAFQDDAKAKFDGMAPEPGKGRVVLVNGATKNVVIMGAATAK